MAKKKYGDKINEIMTNNKNHGELSLKQFNYKNEETLNNITNKYELNEKQIKYTLEEDLEKLKLKNNQEDLMKEIALKQTEIKHKSNMNNGISKLFNSDKRLWKVNSYYELESDGSLFIFFHF